MLCDNKIKNILAYSETAGQEISFIIDRKNQINWRESLICESTQLNNRSRACATLLTEHCGLTPSSRFYITEQTTPLFRWLSSIFPSMIGSEYLGVNNISGNYINNIWHEDLTNLSFESNSFDIVASFDCLEQIPSYKAAISEISRVLKPTGKALLTFPFTGLEKTTVRAVYDDDSSITHILEPEFHGDPINPEGGVLCFYHFGFDILSSMLDLGFSDAYVYWFWASGKANLGGLQPYIIAIK